MSWITIFCIVFCFVYTFPMLCILYRLYMVEAELKGIKDEIKKLRWVIEEEND